MALATASIVELQLEHNAWATREIIEHNLEVSDKEFKMTFGIGPGSLQLILAHMIETMFYFGDNFAGRTYRKRDNFKQRSQTAEGLLELLDESEAELYNAVSEFVEANGIEGQVLWAASNVKIPAHLALCQVFDHGSHHRAQCLNIMRRLGNLDGLEVHPLRFAGAED